jgi:hypothetical protein
MALLVEIDNVSTMYFQRRGYPLVSPLIRHGLASGADNSVRYTRRGLIPRDGHHTEGTNLGSGVHERSG